MPAAVLAAAVVLSLSSTADVTMAAVLVNAGRSTQVNHGESLGQWLTRFTDAARQMRDVFQGDDSTGSHVALAPSLSRFDFTLSLSQTGVLHDTVEQLPFAAPLRANLTDLPPPRA